MKVIVANTPSEKQIKKMLQELGDYIAKKYS